MKEKEEHTSRAKNSKAECERVFERQSGGERQKLSPVVVRASLALA